MAYKVLYRKYRPAVFSDVIGQETVTTTLKNALSQDKVSHAYLFTGSRGTGKTTCAKILSKAVNCQNLQDGDPCLVCDACKGIESGAVLDVMEMDAASNNGVDSIRALIEESAFTPTSVKYRVYIIDEVHMLSDSAFNALLKTLEEPPSHVIFILATTEVHKLLPTILSRCQRFDFKRITAQNIADRLQTVCSEEGIKIDDEAALLIARLSDGGMRDALSMLDRCMAKSGDISLKSVNEMAGIVGREHLMIFADSIKENDCVKALSLIDDLYQNSKDLAMLCEELTTHFRNLMLIKTMKDAKDLIRVSGDELETMTAQALSMPLPLILHCLERFSQSLDKMKSSNRRVELEMAFISLCTPQADTSLPAILRRLEALESGIAKMPVQVQSSQKKMTSSAPISQDNDAIKKLAKTATVFQNWPDVINIIKNTSKTVGMAFTGSTAYLSGNYVLIDGSDLAFEYLRKNAEHRDNLKNAIAHVTGKGYNIGPYLKDDENKVEQVSAIDELMQTAIDAGIEVIEKNNN